jgi:hypothetical protein
MISAKKLLLAGSAFGFALVTAPAFAAPPAALSLRGVGSGSLAIGSCAAIACPTGDTCECLNISDKVNGTLAFNNGQLLAAISINTSHALPITANGVCLAATGQGTLANANGKQSVNIFVSGFACDSLAGVETFNGTYVIQNGAGSFATANGTGAINGTQELTPGTVSQVTMQGSVQK